MAHEEEEYILMQDDDGMGIRCEVQEEEYIEEDEDQMATGSITLEGEDKYFFHPTVVPTTVDTKFILCDECGAEFATCRKLYTHLFDVHAYSKHSIELIKSHRRISLAKKSRSKKTAVFICKICDLKYASKSGYANHMKKIHDEQVHRERHIVDSIVCPRYGCEKTFFTYMELAIHVDTHHRDMATVPENYRIHRVKFTNYTEFTKWRKRMELETNSDFFTRTTEGPNKRSKRTILLKCMYSNTRHQAKGHRSEQCPSFMRVCEWEDGDVEVVACFGHLGHEHPTETGQAINLRLRKFREEEERLKRLQYVNVQGKVEEQDSHVLDNSYVVVSNEMGDHHEEQVYVQEYQ